MYKGKYREGSVINGHKIQTFYSHDSILVQCGNCKSLVIKSRKSIDNHIGCKNCRNRYKRISYIYGIPNAIISKKLSRGWTIEEIIGSVPRKIPNESFSQRDLIYLGKINEKLYKENIEAAESAINKYRLKKN